MQKNNAEIGFRLSPNEDPEERLEEAILWKQMRDYYGDRIGLVEDPVVSNIPTFGRNPRIKDFSTKARNPVPKQLDYWNDPAFLKHCGRSFTTSDYNGLNDAVAAVHETGNDAIIKSTQAKHHIQRVPLGVTGTQALGDMAYSFMDGGPKLMVQTHRPMFYEFRFFVVEREIVTRSPQLEKLTPLDFPSIGVTGFRNRQDARSACDCGSLIGRYIELVSEIAQTMQTDNAAVDVAQFENGEIGVVEFNPMQIGQIGLFACDTKALVRSSERILESFYRQNADVHAERASTKCTQSTASNLVKQGSAQVRRPLSP